jgi:hypothetical protein
MQTTVILYIILTLFKACKYQVLLQQKTNCLRVLNVVIVQNSPLALFIERKISSLWGGGPVFLTWP